MSSTDDTLPLLDVVLWTALVQILLIGVYMAIFCQTIVRLVPIGQHKIYASALVALFAVVITHSGTNIWMLRRDILLLNDVSNEKDPFIVNAFGQLAAFLSLWFGDVLLLWRCYILWTQNKILLFIFASVMLGEVVVFALVWFSLSVNHDSLLVAILVFSSLGATVFATALIIYRIRDISRDIDDASTKYNFTVKVLAESGALYAAALVVVCIFLASKSKAIGPNAQGIIFWIGLATPMAGIAPTLIALRVTIAGTRDTSSTMNGMSSLRFNRSQPPMNEGRSSVIQDEQQ